MKLLSRLSVALLLPVRAVVVNPQAEPIKRAAIVQTGDYERFLVWDAKRAPEVDLDLYWETYIGRPVEAVIRDLSTHTSHQKTFRCENFDQVGYMGVSHQDLVEEFTGLKFTCARRLTTEDLGRDDQEYEIEVYNRGDEKLADGSYSYSLPKTFFSYQLAYPPYEPRFDVVTLGPKAFEVRYYHDTTDHHFVSFDINTHVRNLYVDINDDTSAVMRSKRITVRHYYDTLISGEYLHVERFEGRPFPANNSIEVQHQAAVGSYAPSSQSAFVPSRNRPGTFSIVSAEYFPAPVDETFDIVRMKDAGVFNFTWSAHDAQNGEVLASKYWLQYKSLVAPDDIREGTVRLPSYTVGADGKHHFVGHIPEVPYGTRTEFSLTAVNDMGNTTTDPSKSVIIGTRPLPVRDLKYAVIDSGNNENVTVLVTWEESLFLGTGRRDAHYVVHSVEQSETRWYPASQKSASFVVPVYTEVLFEVKVCNNMLLCMANQVRGFIKQPEEPVAAPLLHNLTALQPYGLTVSWETVPLADRYLVQVRQFDTEEWNSQTVRIGNDTNMTMQTQLHNLSLGVHEVRVAGVRISVIGNFTSSMFEEVLDLPLPPVRLYARLADDAESLSVYWSGCDDDKTHVQWEDTENGEFVDVVVADVDESSFQFNATFDDSVADRYRVRASCVNPLGESAWSDWTFAELSVERQMQLLKESIKSSQSQDATVEEEEAEENETQEQGTPVAILAMLVALSAMVALSITYLACQYRRKSKNDLGDELEGTENSHNESLDVVELEEQYEIDIDSASPIDFAPPPPPLE